MNEPKKKNGTGGPDGSSQNNQPQPCRPIDPKMILVAALVTRKQVAERWSCCEHTIARRKDLKPLHLGLRLVRYRLADIEAIEKAAQ